MVWDTAELDRVHTRCGKCYHLDLTYQNGAKEALITCVVGGKLTDCDSCLMFDGREVETYTDSEEVEYNGNDTQS